MRVQAPHMHALRHVRKKGRTSNASNLPPQEGYFDLLALAISTALEDKSPRAINGFRSTRVPTVHICHDRLREYIS